MWGLFIATGVFGLSLSRRGRAVGGDGSMFLYIAIAVTAICIPLALWRVSSFRKAFARGVEVPGLVRDTSFYRGRGRLEFTYTYQGREYTSAASVQESAAVAALSPNSRVTVILDPEAPAKAYLRDLFAD
jgi:hypothetical protein